MKPVAHFHGQAAFGNRMTAGEETDEHEADQGKRNVSCEW